MFTVEVTLVTSTVNYSLYISDTDYSLYSSLEDSGHGVCFVLFLYLEQQIMRNAVPKARSN
jgi:hypothetical protein